MTLRLAVFASGGGTNLQALIDRFNHREQPPALVALVISDRADAGAVQRARAAAVPTAIVPVAGREEAEAAADTLAALDDASIDAVALAGYLRLIPSAVVARYRDRMLNIHPALLPAFGGRGMYGMRVHRAVLEAGCLVTGVTVHYVDERYDEGRALAQWPVPVLRGDSPESLAARVLRIEHMLYPIAIELLANAIRDSHAPSEAAGFDHRSGLISFGWSPDIEVAERDLRRTFGLD